MEHSTMSEKEPSFLVQTGTSIKNIYIFSLKIHNSSVIWILCPSLPSCDASQWWQSTSSPCLYLPLPAREWRATIFLPGTQQWIIGLILNSAEMTKLIQSNLWCHVKQANISSQATNKETRSNLSTSPLSCQSFLGTFLLPSFLTFPIKYLLKSCLSESSN